MQKDNKVTKIQKRNDKKKDESRRYRTQNPRFKLPLAGGSVNHCTTESNVVRQ